jgi:hypothetical protein
LTTTTGIVPPTFVTDPFGRTKFRVVWDSTEIPGISSISPLEMTVVGAGSTAGTSVGTNVGSTSGSTAGTSVGTNVGSTSGSTAGTSVGSTAGTSVGSTAGSTNVLTAAEAAAQAAAAAALAAAEAVGSNAAQAVESTAQSVLSGLESFADRRPSGPEVTRWVVSPVELTRPRTMDDAFQSWVLAPVEKVVLVELSNLAGGPGLVFRLWPCVPVSYVPLDTVDAESSGVALERLTISCTSIETIRGEPTTMK